MLIICPVDAGVFRYLTGRNVLKLGEIANGVAGLPYGACMRIIGTKIMKLLVISINSSIKARTTKWAK